LPEAGLLQTFTQKVSGAAGSIALFATQVAEYMFNATQPVKSTVLQPFVLYNPSQPAIVTRAEHPDDSSTGDVWALLSLVVAVELTYKLAFITTFAESPPADLFACRDSRCVLIHHADIHRLVVNDITDLLFHATGFRRLLGLCNGERSHGGTRWNRGRTGCV